MKSIIRDLTPPLLWRHASRIVARFNWAPPAGLGFERSSEWYDTGYAAVKSYSKHYADSPYYPLWCVMLDRLAPAKVRCLFDVGCGPGQFAAFLRDQGLPRYVGLDFSDVCIRMAKSACEQFEFVCADAFKTDLFETLDYDVLVATEFLEHVENDLAIINRIRPGTRFYGSVPSFPHAGHVRYFSSSEEVMTRYAEGFDNFRVDEFLLGSKGISLFLIQGIRREAAI